MNGKQLDALMELTEHPAQVGRWCGFKLLTDELHGAWMTDMINGTDDRTILAHRGSYKTTCLTVALAVMLCCYPWKTLLFMRKADDDVVEVIKQVRMLIESEPFKYLTAQIYGKPVTVTRYNATEITTSAFASPRGSAQLLGVGTGGSITGKHADIVITDDIVNIKDRGSRAERERVKSIYMELQNIRNRGGRIINTGTPWHKEDAISIMPNVLRFDCYQTGLITKDKLEELRASMSPSLFAANYELKHIAAENALFDTQPAFTSDASFLRDGLAHIDAAYGGEDYTALTLGKRRGDTLYLYGRLWRSHVDTVLDAALTECKRLLCAPVWCENNGDKGYLGKEIRARGYEAHIYAERQNKYLKISTHLRKWWKNIVFLEGTDREYISQIMDYTEEAEHDDAPDSAAVMCRILDRGQLNLLGA